jgi:hypothetical protein
VAASTPGGAPLGDFGLTIGPNYFYFLSNVGDGELAALIDTSLYWVGPHRRRNPLLCSLWLAGPCASPAAAAS